MTVEINDFLEYKCIYMFLNTCFDIAPDSFIISFNNSKNADSYN